MVDRGRSSILAKHGGARQATALVDWPHHASDTAGVVTRALFESLMRNYSMESTFLEVSRGYAESFQ